MSTSPGTQTWEWHIWVTHTHKTALNSWRGMLLFFPSGTGFFWKRSFKFQGKYFLPQVRWDSSSHKPHEVSILRCIIKHKHLSVRPMLLSPGKLLRDILISAAANYVTGCKLRQHGAWGGPGIWESWKRVFLDQLSPLTAWNGPLSFQLLLIALRESKQVRWWAFSP